MVLQCNCPVPSWIKKYWAFQAPSLAGNQKGPVEYSSQIAQKCPQQSRWQQPVGMFKKVVQQGRKSLARSRRVSLLFDARSVHRVREHGKMGRTPLAAFFNIPGKNACQALEIGKFLARL